MAPRVAERGRRPAEAAELGRLAAHRGNLTRGMEETASLSLAPGAASGLGKDPYVRKRTGASTSSLEGRRPVVGCAPGWPYPLDTLPWATVGEDFSRLRYDD
ncbi:hypothetical protein KM043_005861 [Ampulex compressa]|nr:hypothetical protein KM043_005861 [Ampulex compressa]